MSQFALTRWVRGAQMGAVAAAMLCGTAAHASLINVQFGETSSIFGPTPHYSGAAVLGAAGDRWNFIGGDFNPNYKDPNATGWGRTITDQPLVDVTGAATGVRLSLTTPDAFIALENFSPIFKGSPYAALMDSFVFADGHRLGGPGTDGPGTVTIAGLAPGGQYKLILYAAGDVIGRKTTFTLDGQSRTVTPSGAAALTEGDTYASFVAAADASGVLSFIFAAGNGLEANLNGLQLTEVPEPASLALLGAGLAGLGLARSLKAAGGRRRRTSSAR